jgi:ABC-type antimicrobial peptide transport system permease subunit
VQDLKTRRYGQDDGGVQAFLLSTDNGTFSNVFARLDPTVNSQGVRAFQAFVRQLGILRGDSRLGRLDELYEPLLKPARFLAGVATGLGLAALLISSLGLYSLLTFSAQQRHREFALRIALGASRRDITKLMVVSTLAPVVSASLLGLTAGYGIIRLTVVETPRPVETVALSATILCVLVTIALAVMVPPLRYALTSRPNAWLQCE